MGKKYESIFKCMCSVSVTRPDLHKVSRRHLHVIETDAARQHKELLHPFVVLKREAGAGLELGEIGALAIFLPDRAGAEARLRRSV